MIWNLEENLKILWCDWTGTCANQIKMQFKFKKKTFVKQQLKVITK